MDQRANGLMECFLQWRHHRIALRSDLGGPDLRHYYRTDEFRMDFLSFVKMHPVGNDPIVAALLEYEYAMNVGCSGERRVGWHLVPVGAPLRWGDVPARDQASVVSLSCDVQRVVDALKSQHSPQIVRATCLYVKREISRGLTPLDRLSDWVTCLLCACDGERTIREVMGAVKLDWPGADESVHNYALLRLLLRVHSEGFVKIYRSASDAAVSHDGGFDEREYSEMSDAASLQNQFSTHLQ